MDLIGKQVRHSKFGDGVIVAQETTTVTVNFFSEIETKKFIYPACFKTYLKLVDAEAAAQADKTVLQHEEQERRKKQYESEMAEAKHFAKKMQEESSRSGKAVIIRPFNSVEDFCAEYKKAIIYTMIMLMMDSGMRLGECSCVTVEDLNLTKRHLILRAEVTKGRKSRTAYFSPRTEQILRRWIQFKDRYVESDYLFPVKHSGAHIEVSTFETNFKKYLRRAGINEKITPHCLRNNFAKRCLMNGMDVFSLSKILGHSSVTVTEQAYLDLTDEDIGKRYQHFSPVVNMR